MGLRPLIIILITASLSSKTNNIALESKFFVLNEMLSMFVGMTLVCLIVMELCKSDLAIADGFLRSSLVGPSVLFGSKRKYFNQQIAESESENTVHA